MRYSVEFSKVALKNIKKLDRSVAVTLLAWISKNLDGTDNPRKQGKALTGDLDGLWRYRVGDYRLLSEIQDDKVRIVILEAGHRSKIYNK